MLQSISWTDYLIVVGSATGVYYGWWVIRYYRSLNWGKKRTASGATEAAVVKAGGAEMLVIKTGEGAKAVEAGTEGTAKATEPIKDTAAGQQLELALPMVITQPVFLPGIATNLAMELTRLLNQCGEELMSEKELINRLQQLLGNAPYDKLKGSPFQEKIDALIGRELEKYGSIRFDPEVIRGLWQG